MGAYQLLSTASSTDLVANVLSAFGDNFPWLAVIGVLVISVPLSFYIVQKIISLFRRNTR